MSDVPTVVSVNISSGGIPKLPVEVGRVTADGIDRDAHDHEKHNTPLEPPAVVSTGPQRCD